MIIVTRYLRQLKKEKRAANSENDSFQLKTHYYARLSGDDREDVPSDTAYHPRHLSYSSATHFPATPRGHASPGPEPEKEKNEHV